MLVLLVQLVLKVQLVLLGPRDNKEIEDPG